MRWTFSAFISLVLLTVLMTPTDSTSRETDNHDRHDPWAGGKIPGPERALVLDGSFVHNIGELQMNITNWGFLGSLPMSQFPMSDSPSA